MKQSCPKCKTIIEIDEKKYYPGSQVEVQCPLCDGKVTFAIPAKAENCAEALAKLNETVSNLQMQIDEMRKASGEEKSTVALKALEDRISRLEYLIQELQYEVNHRRDNVKDERTGTTKNDGVDPDKRKKKDSNGLRTIVVLGVLLLLIVGGMLFMPRMCHNNYDIKDTKDTIDTSKMVETNIAEIETVTVNGVSFNMIRVEGLDAGTFYIGETEVTQALWEAVMGNNPSYFVGSNRPVEQVSWNDCKEFIRVLNALTGQQFRLPKEMEWEYAAKGGKKSHGYAYSGCDSEDDLERYAWYTENAFDYGTHPVKQKQPNELGLYDMSGNVDEWCEDLYDPWESTDRVVRDGSWRSASWRCRVSSRINCNPSNRYSTGGLRLAR